MRHALIPMSHGLTSKRSTPDLTAGSYAANTLISASVTSAASIDFNQRDVAIIQARALGFVQRVYRLAPGDVIACGTSTGVGSMKPGSEVSVTIEGIGELQNRYEASTR